MKKEKRDKEAEAMQAKEKGGWSGWKACISTSAIVVRGEESATVYGCQRILLYSPSHIRLKMRRRVVGISGDGLCCTSFSGGAVTVEGRIESVTYESDKGEELD